MPKVLSSVNIEFKGRSPATEMMEKAGLEVVAEHAKPGWPDDETREKVVGLAALLAGAENLNASTLGHVDTLKVIARNGVGYDKVDLDFCTERGIVVTFTPGAMGDAVADHAFALLLAMTRQLVRGDRNVKEQGAYDVPIGEDLSAMTLGLMGCGRIGAEVVRRALGFRMRVLVHDPWVEAAKIEELGAEAVDRETLLAQADAITLHTPLIDSTKNIVDAAFLAAMREGSYLINTARGGLVDEEALIAALTSNHLAGAGLDCQATEPPTGTSLELVQLENVLAQPHSGSKTTAARERMSIWAAQSIIDVFAGKAPEYVVNKEVLEKLGLK
ncbi:MAG: phosphoglycerate dehydrogenase-like enzyme [Candidatus Latescibacterota bacterium]|jgi:phosphoglycerate dehydrogenase-like enzyme